MKKQIKFIISVLSFVLFSYQTFSQSTITGIGIAGHNGGPIGNYVGWQNANPLWFRTNDATNSRNRMIITDGAFGPNTGQIAMGNNLPNNFAPTARLHLHQDVASNNFISFTHIGVGATATDGFRIGITNVGFAELRQQENLPIIFYENDNSMFTLPI